MSQTSKIDDERAIAIEIETYRQRVLHLSPEQIASIFDAHHTPLTYVAQMKRTDLPLDAIRRYLAALPNHIEKALSKSLADMRIDVLGDTAIAVFISSPHHGDAEAAGRAAGATLCGRRNAPRQSDPPATRTIVASV